MSTRRDRAAKALIGVALELNGRDPADLTTGEYFRLADAVLAEVDRIPDVSEFEELMDRAGRVLAPHDSWHQTGPDEAHERWRCSPEACGWMPAVRPQTGDGVSAPGGGHPLPSAGGAVPDTSSPSADDGAALPVRRDGGNGDAPAAALSSQSEGPAGEAAPPLTDGRAATPPAAPARTPVGAGGDSAAVSATGAVNTGAAPPSVPPHEWLLVDDEGDPYWWHEDAQVWVCFAKREYAGTYDEIDRNHGPMHYYVPLPAGQASSSALPSARPRRFVLFRTRDVTGLSGTGIVAFGTQWPDGTACLRWTTKHPTTVHWESVDAIREVHGHGNASVIHWLDGEE